MGKRALVVLGAGASYDLLSAFQEPKSPDYKPPLTKEIFTSCQATAIHLEHYPGAENLAATIRNRLGQQPSLEDILAELGASKETPTVEDFRQVPVFLQELFGEISTRWVTDPGNYSDLVRTLLTSGFDRIAFVTLNYDLFLEMALARSQLGGPITSIDSYIRDRWILIKLHGSVNWLKRIRFQPSKPLKAQLSETDSIDRASVDNRRKLLLAIIDESRLAQLDPEIRVAENWYDWYAPDEENRSQFAPYYPVLTVPVTDKYDVLCPPEHLKELGSFLQECPNILVIGASGNDKDLLDVLQASVLEPLTLFYLVGGGDKEDEADEAYTNFILGAPKLQLATKNGIFRGGFGRFIREGRLAEFINGCE